MDAKAPLLGRMPYGVLRTVGLAAVVIAAGILFYLGSAPIRTVVLGGFAVGSILASGSHH